MRKLLRSMMRAEAEKKGMIPSKYVNSAWHKYQIDKVGLYNRLKNVAKGTSVKSKWRIRIQSIDKGFNLERN